MKHKTIILLFFCLGFIGSYAQNKELKTEDDGFKWYKLTSDDNKHYGVEDVSGKTLIPTTRGYTNLWYFNGKFNFSINDNDGACDLTGKEIISASRGYSNVTFHLEEGHIGYFGVKKNGLKGACDVNGNEFISPNYETLFYSSTDGFTSKNSEGYYAMGIELDSQGNPYSVDVSSNNSTNNSYSSYSSSSSSTPTVKELFDAAYNTPDSEAQTKYDRYVNVIKADPYNSKGYKTLAFNNIGALFENLGDLKNAKTYYEYALQTDPNNSKAKENLKNVKAQRRSQRWNAISNVLGAVGQGLSNMSAGQTGSSYNSYQGGSGAYSGSYSGSSSGERVCVSCGGSGKCSTQTVYDKYRCHGSGRCQHCNGSGTVRAYGNTIVCSTCNGTRKCNYCSGTGRCSTCGGSGKR